MYYYLLLSLLLPLLLLLFFIISSSIVILLLLIIINCTDRTPVIYNQWISVHFSYSDFIEILRAALCF